jgi:hypothetical protein
VDGSAAQYARAFLGKLSFQFTNTSITWTDPAYDWLATLSGIENAEIRSMNSFTDRYAPIQSSTTSALIMDQPSWTWNYLGYDAFSDPWGNFGFWIQNASSLLTEEIEFFLDSSAGKIHYMTLPDQDMATIDTYLGILDAIVAVGGTYDASAHDITFQSLNFVRQ